jgi:uncharacterized membrane protein
MRSSRKSSISVTLAAAFAAIYALGVFSLEAISFQLFQVRVADALLPLAILFGWPAVIGLTLGAFVGNIFGGLGPIDMIGGSLANFLATYLAWVIARNKGKSWKLVGVIVEIVMVTVIVGSYLSYLFNQPLLITWLGVILGSIVAIGVLGSALLFALSTERLQSFLRSHGL